MSKYDVVPLFVRRVIMYMKYVMNRYWKITWVFTKKVKVEITLNLWGKNEEENATESLKLCKGNTGIGKKVSENFK